jgi:hypothetical protein
MDTINGFGYSYIDWEYAKRKQKDPDLSFDDILKEKMEAFNEEANKGRDRQP